MPAITIRNFGNQANGRHYPFAWPFDVRPVTLTTNLVTVAANGIAGPQLVARFDPNRVQLGFSRSAGAAVKLVWSDEFPIASAGIDVPTGDILWMDQSHGGDMCVREWLAIFTVVPSYLTVVEVSRGR